MHGRLGGALMQLFLDLDGVLVDFVGGCCRLFGKSLNPYPPGLFYIYEAWEMAPSDFYGELARAGSQFWADLDWLPDGPEVLARVNRHVQDLGHEPVRFLSSPTLDPASWAGKAKWVERHLQDGISRLTLTHDKAELSGPGKVLIDDQPKNVAGWIARHPMHAYGLCLPRPWNPHHSRASRALAILDEYLAILGRLAVRNRGE